MDGTCWICGDHADDGQEGYSSTPMVLPGLTKAVWVCGMCIIRAMNSQSPDYWRAEARLAEEVMTVAEAIAAEGTWCEEHERVEDSEMHDLAHVDEYEARSNEYSLGSCGCTDYHMADCPLVTG